MPTEAIIVGELHEFNTGRRYTAEGQRIAWAILEDQSVSKRFVAFIDQDRMIDGVIELHFGNLDLLNDGWVLRAYDDYHYQSYSPLIKVLRAAFQAKHKEANGRNPSPR